MSSSKRNALVGITVLAALGVLTWMLLKFGASPAKYFQNGEQVTIHLLCDRADGLAEGSQVLYRGVSVGRISRLARDNNQRDVLIDALIDNTPPLPSNVYGVIRTQSLISGQAILSLELQGGETAAPSGKLQDQQKVTANYVGSELIPHQFGQLAEELEKTTADVRSAGLVTHLDDSVRQAGQVLTSLHNYVDDPQLRADIQQSLANFKRATESATHAAADIDRFSGRLGDISDQAKGTLVDARAAIKSAQERVDHTSQQLDDRMLQISMLLSSVQSVVSKIDNGKGTAGMLLNDPKMYQALLDSSKQLNVTVSDLKRLVEQWEQEGISFKLN